MKLRKFTIKAYTLDFNSFLILVIVLKFKNRIEETAKGLIKRIDNSFLLFDYIKLSKVKKMIIKKLVFTFQYNFITVVFIIIRF